MMRTLRLGMTLSLLVLISSTSQGAVLFLAHFDQATLDADYAASGLVAASATSGARGGELGYFPGTPSGAADIGYHTPATASLMLPASGNVDPRQGTIEFFLRTDWDWSSEGIGDRPHPSFVWIPLQAGGRIQVYAYHHELSGQVALAFNLNDGQTDHALTAGVSPVGKREVPEPWKQDEWHHIAVSWTPNWARIFADGKLLASTEWDPPLPLPPVQGEMWIGGGASDTSRVLIDELRIQDVPVEQITVPTEPYPLPQPPVAEGAEAPWATIPCYRATVAPTVDGRVDEEAWQQVPWVGGLKKIGSSTEFAVVPTRFALCYDDQALYLAVVCLEPNIAGLRATQPGEDVPVFGDDAIEFFVDPLRKHTPYYQLAFNTIGGHYDGQGMDASWDGEWTVQTAKSEKYWSAELRLPFTTLGLMAAPGQVWGLNVARDRCASGGLGLSTWSALRGFHNPGSFGALRFEPAPPSPLSQEEATLNAQYLEATQALIARNYGLWQRQLERATKQIGARAVGERLRAEAEDLAALVEQLGQIGPTLAELDEARVMMLDLSGAVDYLVAQVQQSTPVGPRQAPADLPLGLSRRGDIWYFVSDRAVFAVDGRSGILAGLWDRTTGQRCIAASADHYWAETVASAREADELDDQATQVSETEGRLRLRCTNPDLPGASLVKEYWLRPEGTLAKQVTASGSPAEKTLLRISSRTYFDDDFRREAYYQRLLHPAIMTDSVKKAREITAPFAQPGFMGQCPDGCSQFCLSDLDSGVGVGQFLLRINGEYAYPPRSLNMSYWTPWGWEMSWLACFLKPEAFSAEINYMLYEGDHFTFHTLYQQLPEWQELLASYTICPWVKKTRMVTMPYVGWGSFPAGDAPAHPDVLKMAQIPAQLQRPDEKMLYLQQQPGDNWGEWAAADGEMARFREPNSDRFLREIPAEKIRHGITRLHGLGLPQYKVGFYQFCLDVSPGTPPERAGWYLVDKQGNRVSGYWDPSCKTYMTDMSAPYIDYTVTKLAQVLDYYNTDFLYIDWPYPPTFADWKGAGMVTQATDAMEFFRRVHQVCQERGKALFINSGAGVPYMDAGIFEGIVTPQVRLRHGFLEDGWRNLFSDPLMMMKLYEPPGFASHAWPWDYRWSDPQHDTSREMTNYSLLFGMRPSAGVNSEWGDQLKAFTPPGGQPEWLANARSIDMYQRAAFELSPSRLVEVRLSPCWWQEDTRIEAYALRLGPAHVLTCLSHYNKPRPVTLSASREALGLEPGQRTFVWVFKVRPLDTIVRQPDPPPPGWDVLCPEITCQSFLQQGQERIEVDLGEMPLLLVRLAAVTQVPGALVSAYGQDTQFVLPHNLDCTVEGSVDEENRTVRLEVIADKPCEIIAWWPPPWGGARVEITGPQPQTLASVPAESYVTYGQERFVRLSLPAGESSVLLKPTQ